MTYFIIFALFMIVLCAIGAYNVISEANDKLKKCCKIVIISCTESSRSVGSAMQCYDLCFEVEGEYVQRTFTSKKYYPAGSEHYVYVNDSMECIEEEADIKKDKRNGKLGAGAIGVLLLGVSAVGLCYFFDPVKVFIIYGIIFLVIGLIYVFVIISGLGKEKKQYNELDLYKVPGRVVELVYNGRGSRMPVYEFYDDGVRRTIEGTIGDGRRSIVRRRVGDEVVIVIDRNSKEAYCENDQTRQKFINIFVLAVGAFCIGCVIWAVMQGQ